MIPGDPLGWSAAYVTYARLEFRTQLRYRASAAGQVAAVVLLILLQFALWESVYRGPAPRSLSLHQVLLYAAVSRIWWQIIPAHAPADMLGRRVRDGSIALELARPVNIVVIMLAREVGRGAARMLLIGLPTMLVTVLVIGSPPSWSGWFAAAVSFVLGYLIAFLLSSLIALLSFLTKRVVGLLELRDACITILGGTLVPLSLYPPLLQRIAGALPFLHVYDGPLGRLVGDRSVAAEQPLVALVWVVALGAVNWGVYLRIRRRIVLQGG